jgi:hypothetical protein
MYIEGKIDYWSYCNVLDIVLTIKSERLRENRFYPASTTFNKYFINQAIIKLLACKADKFDY